MYIRQEARLKYGLQVLTVYGKGNINLKKHSILTYVRYLYLTHVESVVGIYQLRVS